jgi:hypothetical protein
MSSLSQESSHVSLRDSDASAEEIETLRNIMRSDDIPPDECPELPDDVCFDPSDQDVCWWVEQSNSPTPGEPTASTVKLLDFRHLGPGRSVALVENEHPVELEYRYLVIAYADGAQVDFVGSDSYPTAEMIFRHTVKPLPGAREAVARC